MKRNLPAKMLEHSAPPDLALVLGSGLGALAERIENPQRIPFQDVPGLDATTIPGHKGCLTLGTWSGKRVLVFEGRLHAYEGHPWQTVLQPVHIAKDLGTGIILMTNAAGGIRADLQPGSWLALTSHMNLTIPWFWRHAYKASPYSERLIGMMQDAGKYLGMNIPTGTYAQVTGPCYETPAEIRALRSLGADAVGMSTAREIQEAGDLGLECAGLSFITNRAAGLSDGPIHHEEVLAAAATQRDHLGDLVDRFIRLLPRK